MDMDISCHLLTRIIFLAASHKLPPFKSILRYKPKVQIDDATSFPARHLFYSAFSDVSRKYNVNPRNINKVFQLENREGKRK